MQGFTAPPPGLASFSDLGNLYVVLPVAVAIGVWTARVLDWQAALRVVGLLAGLILLVAALKYAAWSGGTEASGAYSSHYRGAPSGHAALAGYTYGIIALFALRAHDRRFGVIWCAVFGSLAIAIAFSRVALGAHPLSEVVGGLSSALLFLLLALPITLRHRPGHEAMLVSATLAVALLAELSGLRFHQEQEMFTYLQDWL